ncbi:MAG: ubiquitin-protein ligase peroxin 12 [Thelocarpon superellum]|nr:MAG: ubiquitin-protein ligase peroxin 12 [Thelocarpon superellum]
MEFMMNVHGGFDHHKPSLFELLSEQQLSSLIPPSLRYLLALATHRHPRYLLRVLNSFDELYALLMLLVERHYLLTHAGGFTENFYGLKRERVLAIKGGELPRAQQAAPGIVRDTLKLGKADIWKNLAIMVGLPYLKRKLDESYDIHIPPASVLGPNFNRDTLPRGATIKQRLLHYYKWFLRNVYPSVNAAYHFSLLVFNLAYLFDGSRYHNPFLWLIGTRIRRLGEEDHRAIELLNSHGPPLRSRPGARPGSGLSIFNTASMTTVSTSVFSSLKFLLPASIFALKFLEWWHASDFARQLSRKAAEGLELPPPIVSGLGKITSPSKSTSSNPSTTSPTSQAVAATTPTNRPRTPPISRSTTLPILTVPVPGPSSSNVCPICLSSIVNPTAVQTGYVFCYTCIFRWVDGSHERQVAFMEGGAAAAAAAAQAQAEARGDAGGGGRHGGEGVMHGAAGAMNGSATPVAPPPPPDEEGWGREEGSRVGRWESGVGRCAVTGRRVLGGTEGLRRVMV